MISIVIPCYEMAGRGVEMLRELIASIRMQTFTDYEIVVSDGTFGLDEDRIPREMGELCFEEGPFEYQCIRGKEGAAANLNNAIDHAKGDIIKPMFQDDKFIDLDSLQKIADVFKRGAEWVACKSQNGGEPGFRDDLFVPYPHNSIENLRQGENTYGSPSVMAWRKNDLRFDERLAWLFDCEFYGRMADRYGVPVFVDTPIYIRQWSGMATETIATGHQRIKDGNYVVEKYRDHGGQPF